MDIHRFKEIIEYSEANYDEIELQIKRFCSETNMKSDSDVRDVILIVRDIVLKKGFLLFEMPFSDSEIGALCYKGDGLGYVVINSTLPEVNSNFAAAHEIYHVFFQKREFKSKIEFVNEYDDQNEDEFAANAFAGALLMPENSFRGMFAKFQLESQELFETICKLMNYYQTPYMATLIRCCELHLVEMKDMSSELLLIDKERITEKFSELWLDARLLEPSYRDDFPNVEWLVRRMGEKFVKEEYINQRTLNLVLDHIKTLSRQIRGDK